jgi:signal recognition particle receptor subunit beta
MILQQYKIVFAGSMGAGKTEAIKSLSEIPVLATEAFNTDSQAHNKMQTTVGIDYGEITLDDGVKLDFMEHLDKHVLILFGQLFAKVLWCYYLG